MHDKEAIELHKKLKGKISTSLRGDVNVESLRLFYTPGVGSVSKYVSEHPNELRDYSWTNNLVAVISDGSAVLGLGNIGPEGAMPVMEGKAMLFKHFAGIDAVPIILDVHTADEIVDTIAAISKSFGGINLEDIAAPICFEVEDRLKESLPIPVMHDDQHGTAIVVLAALINAAKVKGKNITDLKIVIAGAGAAGIAIAKLLYLYAKPSIYMVDSKGVISKNRTDLNKEKSELLEFTNLDNKDGSLESIFTVADTFIGVSRANLVTKEMVASMLEKPIIFAMANPIPEIMPDVAKEAGAYIVATGRNDFPNQINNVLVFPGIFKGALDNGVKKITDNHKISAAEAIASLVESPSVDNIIPSVFNKHVVSSVADTIK